jgi:hypothetical protein
MWFGMDPVLPPNIISIIKLKISDPKMNSRIRELANQAGLLTHNPEDRRTKLDEFAELLIQDCMSQIAMIGVHNFDNRDITWTVECAIANIQRRFGIKQ